jgi:hypothetical protein
MKDNLANEPTKKLENKKPFDDYELVPNDQPHPKKNLRESNIIHGVFYAHYPTSLFKEYFQ